MAQARPMVLCCLLCLVGATVLAPDRPADKERKHNVMNGDDEVLLGCQKPASAFDTSPRGLSAFHNQWERERKYYHSFLKQQKSKIGRLVNLVSRAPKPPSAFEVAVGDLPTTDKVIYFVQGDGLLVNCSMCLDCKLSEKGVERAKRIVAENPDLAQAELVITSPMARALSTVFAAFPGKPLLLDARLQEVSGISVKSNGYKLIKLNQMYDVLPQYMKLWVESTSNPPSPYFLARPKGGEVTPDMRFQDFLRALRDRPERRIIVVSHHDFLHIGLGEKLGNGRVTRRVL